MVHLRVQRYGDGADLLKGKMGNNKNNGFLNKEDYAVTFFDTPGMEGMGQSV